MLNPPERLRAEMLSTALADGWGLEVVSLGYLALGFGSHHWEVGDASGTRWFATVDELAARRTGWRAAVDVSSPEAQDALHEWLPAGRPVSDREVANAAGVDLDSARRMLNGLAGRGLAAFAGGGMWMRIKPQPA